MTQRYEKMFAQLGSKNEGAFIPFVTLGDPNAAASAQILRALVEGGADAIEVAIPFSDPIADGPTIQRSAQRALAGGATPDSCFELIAQFRSENETIPIGLLTYANLAVHDSMERFYRNVAHAGIDSVLVADVPTLEAKPFVETARAHDVDPVLIVPPNIDEQRLPIIADWCGGYTYVVTRRGVTGADEKVVFDQTDLLEKLKKLGAPPSVFGFGISRPEHVRAAIEAGAAGAISGSAVVSLFEKYPDVNELLPRLTQFVADMKNATRRHK